MDSTTFPTPTAAPITTKCPKCGVNLNGKLNCCARYGAWHEMCGDGDDNKEHTWTEGRLACKRKIGQLSKSIDVHEHSLFFFD